MAVITVLVPHGLRTVIQVSECEIAAPANACTDPATNVGKVKRSVGRLDVLAELERIIIIKDGCGQELRRVIRITLGVSELEVVLEISQICGGAPQRNQILLEDIRVDVVWQGPAVGAALGTVEDLCGRQLPGRVDAVPVLCPYVDTVVGSVVEPAVGCLPFKSGIYVRIVADILRETRPLSDSCKVPPCA